MVRVTRLVSLALLKSLVGKAFQAKRLDSSEWTRASIWPMNQIWNVTMMNPPALKSVQEMDRDKTAMMMIMMYRFL